MNEYQFLQEQAYKYLRERILKDEMEYNRTYSGVPALRSRTR